MAVYTSYYFTAVQFSNSYANTAEVVVVMQLRYSYHLLLWPSHRLMLIIHTQCPIKFNSNCFVKL